MKMRLASLGVLTGVLCAGSVLAAPPGTPKFDAAAYGLENRSPGALSNTEFLRVPGDMGPGPVMQDPKRPYKHGEQNRVADPNYPNFQPWAKQFMTQMVKRLDAGALPFITTSRCWPGGVPGIHLFTGDVFYLQKPKEVWILQTREAARRVFMDQPHSKNPGYSWYGESVGHYENGDTLVIDTIGLDDKIPMDRLETPYTRSLHVVERQKLTDGGNWVSTRFTVDDPKTFVQPFDALVEMKKTNGARWEEYVCSENANEYFVPEGDIMPPPMAKTLDF